MISLLLAAALPALHWTGSVDTASQLKQAGVERVYVNAANTAAWTEAGFQAESAERLDQFTAISAPQVRMEMSIATATRVPWVDANGWRFLGGVDAAWYQNVPKGQAALAAAEAFSYGVDAVLDIDPEDLSAFGEMLRFLRTVNRGEEQLLADLGFINDQSSEAQEAMKLLERRNLLFRAVFQPDPTLDLTVQLGTDAFPRERAVNPHEFAALVRSKLTDERRMLRIFGSNVVLGHVTRVGDVTRVHLLNYRGQRAATDLRLWVEGSFSSVRVASNTSGETAVADIRVRDGGTEFTVPSVELYAVVDLSNQPAATLSSPFAEAGVEPSADPTSPFWSSAPPVHANRNNYGDIVPGHAMEIRSRWTREHLYLLFTCDYDTLHLKPGEAVTHADTRRLWTWDVVEAFLGSDFDNIQRYREFQASPRSEWTDLDIRRDDRENQQGSRWNSGFQVRSQVDSAAKKWYGEMKIPFASLPVPSPQVGTEIRAGLFRIAGPEDARRYVAWQPSGEYSFHVPERFGLLRLTN